MEKPDTYIATIRRAHQIESDKWDIWHESVILQESTSVAELYKWVAERTNFSGNYTTSVTILFAAKL